MSFSQAISTCFRKYAVFSGRATRSEYWYFVLFLILGGIACDILDGIVFGGSIQTTENSVSLRSEGPLNGLFSLLTLLPSLAAGWRRMHDTGRSGLYLLYPLIVIVGIGTFTALFGVLPWQLDGIFMIAMSIAMVILIISPLLVLWWLSRPSQPGANEWGAAPVSVDAQVTP
ncbi:DUF805 domain-containing protein [Pseudooceanicola sediminis]|uniref:DUF805 domain-containing protein n=1 Tax=Pseudooceanicola sediminis TaxID=2211117 RepID=A0A399J6D4_9RHOB|nr:DUF805 domain-containing protein [Pseudooceanicola sediminis]KAA2314633.1 DUF805 domain-containing protein [Puniceibacterium sp. HSS470]RII39542.1 DUF805 domain-containing protein [Pseudooceanicola sediminis]